MNRIIPMFLLIGCSTTWTVTDSKGQEYSETVDLDGDGYGPDTLGGEDCDNEDADTYPGATTYCDPIMNDLDGDGEAEMDRDCDGVPDADLCDVDGDGLRPVDGDCDDYDAASSPDLPEDCDDYAGVDNDCDGYLDDEDDDCNTDTGGDR